MKKYEQLEISLQYLEDKSFVVMSIEGEGQISGDFGGGDSDLSLGN